MKTIDIHEAQAPLADYASIVMTEPVLITSEGRPFMALIDVEDVDAETISLSLNPKFREILEHSRFRQVQEGGLSPAEMRRRLHIEEA